MPDVVPQRLVSLACSLRLSELVKMVISKIERVLRHDGRREEAAAEVEHPQVVTSLETVVVQQDGEGEAAVVDQRHQRSPGLHGGACA